MSVTPAEVRRIAHLARLRLSEETLGRLTGELNTILEHVDALGSVDDQGNGSVDRAEAGAGDLSDSEVGVSVRSTRAGEGSRADELGLDPAAIAPDWREGFFVVPPPPGVHRGEDGP